VVVKANASTAKHTFLSHKEALLEVRDTTSAVRWRTETNLHVVADASLPDRKGLRL
jgi:hypothetical protein